MKEKKNTPDWPTSFGESKKYYIFLARYNSSICSFIRHIQRLMHKKFAFLGHITPKGSRDDLYFPLFYTTLQNEPDEYFILLPNRIDLHPSMDTKADKMQDLFFFDDDHYLFNRQGKFVINCQYVDYDYVCILFCDKDSSIEDFIDSLFIDEQMEIQDISSILLSPTGISPKKNKVLNLLYDFLGDAEVMINDYRNEHLKYYLAPRKSIASPGIKNIFILNERFISAELWRKEEY